MGKGQACTEGHLRGDDTVAAEEVFLAAEHVHRAALALGIAAAPARELRHDSLGIHGAGQHVAVIAVACNDAVTGRKRCLHADNYRLLADIEMAEAADQAHAIELARLLLKAAYQQHVPVIFEKFSGVGRGVPVRLPLTFGDRSHAVLPDWRTRSPARCRMSPEALFR